MRQPGAGFAGGPAFRLLTTGALGAVLTAGVLAGTTLASTPAGGEPVAAASHAAPVPPTAPLVPPSAEADPTSPVPLSIRIPTIGVDAGLVPLDVDGAGVLVPPTSAADPGWHAAGTVPGEVGPAVVAGHVDSRSGPGVFHRLDRLRSGDEVEVVRSDGVAVFRVLSVETVAKGRFPTQRVYGPTPVPELHLITCGGDFDRATGHYASNVIVLTELVAVRPERPT